MLRRFSKPKLASLLVAGVALVGLGGAAVLATSPHRPALQAGPAVSPIARATPSATTTPGPSPAATSPATEGPRGASATPRPAVAGAVRTPAPTATPAPPSATAAPTPVQSVTLNLEIKGQNRVSYAVKFQPNMDACSILAAAQAEGKITYSATYYASIGSYFVTAINGYANGHPHYWTFLYNGSVSPKGCSYVHLGANDNITWRFQ